jgi:hypothetical protein
LQQVAISGKSKLVNLRLNAKGASSQFRDDFVPRLAV